MTKKSGTITLPISEHMAEVGEPFREPRAVSWLQECWVRVFGIPDKLPHESLIKEFLRVAGKAVVIDELSIMRPDMGGGSSMSRCVRKFGAGTQLRFLGSFEIFREMHGFIMRVEREVGGPLAPNPPPPPACPRPPTDEDHDADEDSYRSLTIAGWDGPPATTNPSGMTAATAGTVSSHHRASRLLGSRGWTGRRPLAARRPPFPASPRSDCPRSTRRIC